MGKGKPRAVEKGVLGQNLSSTGSGSLQVPPAPVYYPTEEEFKDPLEYIYKIRPEAEKYGICKIVPPKSWSPPFALDLDTFSFPTKTQAIHQLQARPASCDSETFELEYRRFLEDHCGKKLRKKVIFEGEELDLCKLFNAVKRFGGYDKVSKVKKWGDVSKFVSSAKKISECAKHVLCQLYFEHLYDYEKYYTRLNKGLDKCCKRGATEDKNCGDDPKILSFKRRRKNADGDKVKVSNNMEEEHDQICEQCKSGLHGEVMLLCDRCNKGWHIYCLSPPLKQIPPGNWYCFECLNSDKDSFGFVPGKQFTMEAFRRVADRAKRKWFGSGSASRMQMEKKFWEIVEGSAGEVKVMYGSDLDTSICGSGFPRVNDPRPESVDAKVWDEYCASPWNINNLPKLKGSMLQAVHHNITGVMVPWLYIGMLFSSFCWHFEDHCFYSMNYMHWGEPKCWYSVPGSEANAFEEVMRKSFPDLFDAQPDLLFQLVTMLNPSVLQENRVPVYSTLQEPGNFVITFPRSYHGGFNFGLNCAEAVNFAPADWLPHGGFGADLYQKYHKTAVLSHEELLCVVAKFQANGKSEVSPYLKKEMLRIYTKEKSRREKLWKSGITKSSPMSPRKCPKYVGTEEDPTCLICKQYLYLSAVVCRCRPSAFVCLEHWEHVCECKRSRLRLLYRFTLAELYDLMLNVDKSGSDERLLKNSSQRHNSSCETSTLTKKVKGGQISLAELADQWLVRSYKILTDSYSGGAYDMLLKEAEQFLWAGFEMDRVRERVKILILAQKWAEGIRDCVSKIKTWSSHSSSVKKVDMECISALLSLDPVPCKESEHLKLKEHADEAKLLIQDIESALSSCSKVSDLELLYSRTCASAIYLKESEKLLQKLSSAKEWMESARKCISETYTAAVDIDMLYKLESEIPKIQVELPEEEMLLDLVRKAKSCQALCNEILRFPIRLGDVEGLLEVWNRFTVKVPELVLIKQYHLETISWIDNYNELLVNIHLREDQENVVNQLQGLLTDGSNLRIQVDEKLSVTEVELKKACCRQKALKARDSKVSFDFVQEVIVDSSVLQIQNEKLFIDLRGVLDAAISWEERVANVLEKHAPMSEFEDILRCAETIFLILPTLNDVKNAIATANCWLKNSEPFLRASSRTKSGSCSLLELTELKELIFQSKSLKIVSDEIRMLDIVLKNCEEWEQVACSALQDAAYMLDASSVAGGVNDGLTTRIELLAARIESITKSGLSIGFDFPQIQKLQSASHMLQWCNTALSFCNVVPPLKDVESLLETSENLSATCVSGSLFSSLTAGVKWLKNVLEALCGRSDCGRCQLSEAEELLLKAQSISISFPVAVGQLAKAIQKHKLWQEQVHQFFHLSSEERSLAQMLELKELGKADAFSCSELDTLLIEVGKVQNWMKQCAEIVQISVHDESSLFRALNKIRQSLDMSLNIFSKCSSERNVIVCCIGNDEEQEILSCSTCNDRYHLQCLGKSLVGVNDAKVYVCSYCRFLEDPSSNQNEVSPMRCRGTRPELSMMIKLLFDAENFFVGIEERNVLQKIVELAQQCKTCLAEILDFELSHMDEDLIIVSKRIIIALKAIEVAGVYDPQSKAGIELAVARNSWRTKAKRLVEGQQKPTMQQVRRHMKAGKDINIQPEDHLMQKLTKLKNIGQQWADNAKKVALDDGALRLDKVVEVIRVCENLPVQIEKEVKLLRDRSMLYCICRKPVDNRAKVTCDQCGEWYHVECIKLPFRPKIYVCAACDPQYEASISSQIDLDKLQCAKFVEPKTPSPRLANKDVVAVRRTNTSFQSRGIERLWWRNRKPFRRAAKKRAEVQYLSPLFHIQEH